MKNTNEIIEKIQNLYTSEMNSREYMKRLSAMEEERNHHKKAHEYEEYANNHQERMNALTDMYSFITGKDWCDSVRDLHDFARNKNNRLEMEWEEFKKSILSNSGKKFFARSIYFGWIANFDSANEMISAINGAFVVTDFLYTIVNKLDGTVDIEVIRKGIRG